MSKDKPHNDLDNFLKESFKDHTIKPAPELWDKIEGKFQPTVVPIHQYARLKLALYASAIVIAGLVAVIMLSEKETTELLPKSESEPIAQYSEPPVKAQTTEPKSVRVEKQNESIEKQRQLNLEPAEQNAAIVKLAENKEKIKAEQLAVVEEGEIQDETKKTPFSPEKSHSNTSDLSETNKKNESTVLSENVDEDNKTIVSKISTSEKTKEDSVRKRSNANKKSNRAGKRRVSKNNLPKRKNLTDYNRKGKILNDFTFKLNLTPAVTQLLVVDEDAEIANYQHIEMDNPGFTFNGGIEIEYSINENWIIYSGIKTYYFKQTFEETEYQIPSPFQNNQPFKSSAGTYLLNSDSPEELPNSETIDSYLKLRYLDIPFMARYQIRNVYFDGGINYSYLIDNHSSTRATNNSALTFQQNGGIKEHAFGFTAGFGYKKTFNSGYRLEFGPEIKINVNNIYTGEEATGIPIFIGLRTAICLSRYFSE